MTQHYYVAVETVRAQGIWESVQPNADAACYISLVGT